MKKLMIFASSLMLVGAFACPSMAEVFVFADIFKDKDKFVDEFVFIDKDVFVDVQVDLWTDQAAEAQSIVNQSNTSIEFSGLGEESSEYTNVMDFSVLNNSGIVGVNQAAGNVNNQGNVVSLAAVGTPRPGDIIMTRQGSDLDPTAAAFAHAEASAEQVNTEMIYAEIAPFIRDDLLNSANDNTGIIGINQSSGHLNNQVNAVALAAGLNGTAVAMAESDLGQLNSSLQTFGLSTQHTDLIANSINGNQGVIGVNQSAGTMNNQANIVSIAFTP